MLLYTSAFAPNPRRLSMFIAHKGITIQRELVDLRSGATRSENFLKKNPRGILPMLELDDGSILCDAVAIGLYLEDLYPEKPLFGTNSRDRAFIISWDQYLYTDLFLPLADILRNTNPAFVDNALPGPLRLRQIRDLADRGHQRLGSICKILDDLDDSRLWLVGSEMSWADVCVLAWLDFAERVVGPMPNNYQKLRHRHQRLRAELPGVD
jgi:glutathione S-transferase